ncbi:phosphoribosyl transferase [Patescibacteria group bacterium]|nr:phosphoribosyl transferase [Patescibacteria group bacterium]
MPIEFKNREDAGEKLAKQLNEYKDKEVVVYGLPRGGVVVASRIADILSKPLDIISVKKIGHPNQPEFAIAAVTESGLILENEELVGSIDRDWYENYTRKLHKEAQERRENYLKGEKMISAKNKTAIIVDDGIATGLTMLAAIEEIKENNPEKVIVAIPVIPPGIVDTIKKEVDELIALEIPEDYQDSVSAYYQSFPEISDSEVISFLEKNKNESTKS